MNAVKRLNEWLAVVIVRAVGSMWCAYAFGALTLLSLPDAVHAGKAAVVAWIAQTFLQLVLLSVIMVGQDVNARSGEKRAADDHRRLMLVLANVQHLLREVKRLHHELHERLGIDTRAN